MRAFDTAGGKRQPISITRPAAKIEELVESEFVEDLIAAAGHGSLTEDLALALLRRRELPAVAIEALTRNRVATKDRKVLVQIVQHQRTPRHVSLPLLRRLFIFELMHVTLAPAVAADIKLVAEELIVGKIETISLGECISLARQASPTVAGALLLHSEKAVIDAALQNPRMTEACIVRALGKPEVPLRLLSMLMDHHEWSMRREIQIAVLHRPEAGEHLVRRVAARIPKSVLHHVLDQFRLPAGREALLRQIANEAK